MKQTILSLVLFISACNFSTNHSTKKEYFVINESKTEQNLKQAESIGTAAIGRFADEAKVILQNVPSSSFNINWGKDNTADGKVKVYVRCSYNGKSKAEKIDGLMKLINSCHEFITTEFN